MKNHLYTHKGRHFIVRILKLVSPLASEHRCLCVEDATPEALTAPGILENIHSVKTLQKYVSPTAITRVHASGDICE